MTISRTRWATLAFLAATAGAGAFAYARLPAGAMLAVHYNLAGQATGAAPKGQVLFIVPAIAVLVIGALMLLPRLAPTAGRLARSRGAYDVVLMGVAGVLFVAEDSIAAKALWPAFDLLRSVFLAVAVMLIVVGNVVGKIRQNYLFGLRTPWTLGDERVWDKTHRFTGWIMVAAGLVLAVVDFAAPNAQTLIAGVVICAASPLLIGAAYSARIWRREHA